MGKFTCKNPAGAPTRKQTFAVFCLTGQDIRDINLTRQEVSDLIGALKSTGKAVLPEGRVLKDNSITLYTKDRAKGGGVKSKARPSKTIAGTWASKLIKQAEQAGEKALQELIDSNKVRPMVVQQHADMTDDDSPVTEQWVVAGGPCGFASIRVKCTNGPSRKFINQLKKVGLAGGDRYSGYHTEWSKSDYYGGYMKSFTLIGGQSLAYKSAYAYAYARVLEDAGIDTWVWTRMD